MPTMNLKDQELHARIHKKMMEIHPDDIFKDRIRTFEIVENVIRKNISGDVLDIGCGNAYASIWLAKNRENIKVTALEGSKQAVQELIPRNIKYHKVEDLVSPKLGSFDNLDPTQRFDYIFAFGALHHSECLYSTMKSISSSLKCGGYLFANEPTMPNDTTNNDYRKKYDIVQDILGLEIRNGDRHDHFFREAEYITAAIYSGFDLIKIEKFAPAKNISGHIRSLIQYLKNFKLTSSIINGINKGRIIKQVSTAGNSNGMLYKSLTRCVYANVYIFRKSENGYIPHLWKQLNTATRISPEASSINKE